MIFVNLPTTDLDAAKAFYVALGCEINQMFTDENAASIVWDENTFFMVLTHEHFSQFTDKTIVDARTQAQVPGAPAPVATMLSEPLANPCPAPPLPP